MTAWPDIYPVIAKQNGIGLAALRQDDRVASSAAFLGRLLLAMDGTVT
jgi:hypothetical protein